MFTDSVSSVMLERAMAAGWQRAQLITHNIANQDTPGFMPKRLEFENLLRSEMQRGAQNSMLSRQDRINRLRGVDPRVHVDDRTTMRADGNNVDRDAEHIELARVQLQYQALRDKINSHFNRLSDAISGGR